MQSPDFFVACFTMSPPRPSITLYLRKQNDKGAHYGRQYTEMKHCPQFSLKQGSEKYVNK